MNARGTHPRRWKQGGAEAGQARRNVANRESCVVVPPVYSLTCWPVSNVAATFGKLCSAFCFIVIIELN